MKKYKTIQVTPSAHKIFKLLARRFTVEDREMHITELVDLIAAKSNEIAKILDIK